VTRVFYVPVSNNSSAILLSIQSKYHSIDVQMFKTGETNIDIGVESDAESIDSELDEVESSAPETGSDYG
jgi:hypothetical protein